MGEVYLARDTKLNREVALKILPTAFAGDADRMARFQREAQVLASLNHPNIASIYGLEESGSTRALVMELVDGQTLAERISVAAVSDRRAESSSPPNRRSETGATIGAQRAPVQLDETLSIAKQITEALEFAHERGIIHRDLKPANIKITHEGTVKVLDFGLAKALAPEESARNISNSPTISMAATQAGMILGTAAYMSPEQAKGKKVDRRADIWAFGCVLYEMLTGKKAFEGETTSDVLAAVIRAEPDWNELPANTPQSIRRLMMRCLQKDSKQRLRDIGEARIAIEEILNGTVDVVAATSPSPVGGQGPSQLSRRRAITWSLAVLAALSTGALLWSLLRTPPRPTQPIARFAVLLSPSDRLALGLTPVLALSPDGSRLVYVASHGGGTKLYVRPIDNLEATPIPGTDGAESPFFSPDGQSVGFFADSKLKRISLTGGAPLTLCNAAAPRGATWGADGNIILTPSFGTSSLFRVSAAGGTPKPLTIPDRKKGEISHRWPQILPGGKAVLFTIWTGGNFDDASVGVQSLETGERRTLLEGGTYARYVPSGHLVYARAGGLLAVPFDLKRLEVTGPPVSILEGVRMVPTTGAAEFSSSDDGSFAYVAGGLGGGERALLWVDRKGASVPLPAPARAYLSPRLSPDGRRLAVGTSGNSQGVWLYDLARGALTRVAETPLGPSPIWTPDGKRLTFNSTHQGPWNLFWMPTDGSGSIERLTTSENAQSPGSWSPDGQVLAFSELDPTTGYDIWVLRLAGGRKAQPFIQTPSNESAPAFSPDGRWLAYLSDESGRTEVYVLPFPGPGGKWQISTEGGTEPIWARNGRELFYRNGNKMMVVAVETKAGFNASKPNLLFEGQYEKGLYAYSTNYDVSAGGQRFLMLKSSEQDSAATQVKVVLNWFEELKRRVPTGK